MTKKNYPEELESLFIKDGFLHPPAAIVNADIRRAYDLGRTHATDPLEGYSNLTQTIADGANIDFKKLEGQAKIVCAHGCCTISGNMRTVGHKTTPLSDISGWVIDLDPAFFLEDFLGEDWNSVGDWVLYVKGEIPIQRKTADQLEPGTRFVGKTDSLPMKEVVLAAGGHIFSADLKMSYATQPRQWEVLEVTGTFGGDK